jgi:5-oxoprolinase (ATP-hydrolysing) subunit A
MRVDVNCDLGESFGAFTKGNDAGLMPFITSANIACGFHAGDPASMRRTVRMCMENNVSIGAHPGLLDLQGFGRRVMEITPQEVYELVLYQIGALEAFVRAEGTILKHVKPHGALYNMAAVDRPLADAIADAVYRFDPKLILYGLAGSQLIQAGQDKGLKTANEVFADRSYQADGMLTPRSHQQAVITDPDMAAARVALMLKYGVVKALDGTDISIRAETVCVHGDGPNAIALAKALWNKLKDPA